MTIAFSESIACGFLGSASTPTFDGDNAFQYLVKQCEFGPRVPGTQAHRECLAFLTKELQNFGARVSHQSFQQEMPFSNQSTLLTNIIASFGIERSERVLLCAHWDSRPWADQDADPANHSKAVTGANDGASGVAVLLEVARQIYMSKPAYGVDIILFDGEDSGRPGHSDTYALGSQYFAANKDQSYRPRWGILLDMVGDSDLEILHEENSLRYAADVVDMVWQRAESLGLSAFVDRPGYEVTDDHLPLLRAGIPCINIIDFNYDHWHTIADTPDNCSPQSLAQVGQLVLSLIYEK
jgi:hypothetical protein